MTFKWMIPVAGLAVMASAALPAQSAPTGFGAQAANENAVTQKANYHYRHHRHYRYYRRPGIYFYGPRHRYWRHHRHWW